MLSLAGCTRSVNARLELGALDRTGTFGPAGDPAEMIPGTPRSGWETTIVIAPIDGIAHGPTMRVWTIPGKNEPPRCYGLMPTARSALESQERSIVQELLNTIDEIGSSVMMVIDPLRHYAYLTSTPSSPLRVWKRTRQDTVWSSGWSPEQAQEQSNDQ